METMETMEAMETFQVATALTFVPKNFNCLSLNVLNAFGCVML